DSDHAPRRSKAILVPGSRHRAGLTRGAPTVATTKGKPCLRAGEFLDAGVLRDVDVTGPVGRDATGAATIPRHEEGAARVELLNAAVVRIRDVDVPAAVGRHAERTVELASAQVVPPPRGDVVPST